MENKIKKSDIKDTDFIQGKITETFIYVANIYEIKKGEETRTYDAYKYFYIIAECFYLAVDNTTDSNEKIRILYEA